MAKELEISLPTLREGLLRLQAEGRIIRKHGKGTFLAQENSSTKPVGILIESDLVSRSISHHYVPLALQIQRKLNDAGRSSEIFFGNRQAGDQSEECLCGEFIRAVRAGHLSGVAVVVGLRSEDWLAQLRQQGVPVVGANSLFDTCILVDHGHWINNAVKILQSEGCQRVAYIGWAGNRPLNPGMKASHEYFIKCLQQRGMPVVDDLIRTDLPPSMDGAGWEEFREIWIRPTAKRPDGLVVSDDMLLQGCFRAIQESRIELPGSLHIMALISDYLQDCNLNRVGRFEISTEETAERYAKALLHLGAPISPIRPRFIPAIRTDFTSGNEDLLQTSPNTYNNTHHENQSTNSSYSA